jgi:hypothetical protein
MLATERWITPIRAEGKTPAEIDDARRDILGRNCTYLDRDFEFEQQDGKWTSVMVVDSPKDVAGDIRSLMYFGKFHGYVWTPTSD